MQSDQYRRARRHLSVSVMGMVFVSGSVIAVASTVTGRPFAGIAALLALGAGGLAVTVLGLRCRRAHRFGDAVSAARFGYASLLAAMAFPVVVGVLSWQSLVGTHRAVGMTPLSSVGGALVVIGTACTALIMLANLAQTDPAPGVTSLRPPGDVGGER